MGSTWAWPAALLPTERGRASVPRKEVIQPHLPVRLPCYDFTPVTRLTLDVLSTDGFRSPTLPWCDGRCVQGPGTYSPRCADPRLLATPTSRGRVAAPDPNYDRVYRDWLRLAASRPAVPAIVACV